MTVNFPFLVRLVSYTILALCQLIFIVMNIRQFKNKWLSGSDRTIFTGWLLFSFFVLVSSVLGMLYQLEFALIFQGIPICIGAVFLVHFFIKGQRLRFEEMKKMHEIETQALELAQAQNTTDETFLRAKNLLVLGSKFLTISANAIRKKVTRQEIYDFVLEKMVDELYADGGIILIVDNEDEVLKVKSMMGIFPPPYQLPADVPLKQNRVETSVKYAEFKFKGNIFADVALKAEPVLVEDASNDERVFINGDASFLKAGSYLFVPFVSNGEVLGLVALSRAIGAAPFSSSDVEISDTLAKYTSTSIHIIDILGEEQEKDTIANEKELATKIQKTLLPEKLPKLSGIDASVYFYAAHGICSDYYDIITPAKDKIFFAMVDVAGKSIQATIIMIMIRTLLNLTTNTDQNTSTILDWVNKGVTKKINIDHFASVALMQYEPQTKKLYYSGAGNTSVSIFHTNTKKFERIRQTTDAIGIAVDSRYEIAETSVESGDVIMLYSDGAIEAQNRRGENFTLPRIYEIVGTNAAKPTKDIIKLLRAAYDEHTEDTPEYDDRSILLVKVS
ncbi:MAG: SpoIIE family protein phosphatase [Spirochaetaceae bacterium]|nr:SpoIIE family protein phosphatase [Spirochaetaceae bacterium]